MNPYTWDEIPKDQLNEALARKIVTGERAMLAQVFLAKDAVVPEHHHESEQISYVLSGSIRFEIEGREIPLGAGQVLVIPSNVPHRVVALEESLSLDIFSPIRQDWLDGTDDYLRKR
jgi:quercetin dioxygenase-like cupin family protein